MSNILTKPLDFTPRQMTGAGSPVPSNLNAPAAPISGGANLNNWDTSLSDLYKQLAGQSPESLGRSSTTTVTTNKANASPELEASIRDWITKQNQVSQQSAGAYTKYQNTFTDLINSLQEVSRAQGSRAASAAGTSALASGMSPYEARSASGSVWRDAISQLMSGVAGLRQGQGQVGVDASKSQADLLGGYTNFMQGVIAPYQMGLAGTTSETQATVDDPTKYYSLLATLAGQLGQQDYQKGTLANQIQQNQISANQALWQYMNTARGQDSNYQAAKDQTEAQQDTARKQLDAQLQQAIITGNTAQAKMLMDYRTELEKANITGQFGLTRQGLANQGTAGAANITGQFGLLNRGLANQGAMDVARLNNPEVSGYQQAVSSIFDSIFGGQKPQDSTDYLRANPPATGSYSNLRSLLGGI